MDQLTWARSLVRPQCIAPLSPRPPDYDRLETEFPPPPPIARDTQKQTIEGLLKPLERLALAQLKYEQYVVRLTAGVGVEVERSRKRREV